MNYRYITIDQEVIVSAAEHEAIQAAFQNGQTVMSLRAGTIGINMATASWKPTSELTGPQEEARSKRLLLGHQDALPSRRMTKAERRKSFCDFRTRMGWEHADLCVCQEKVGAEKQAPP